MTKAIENYDHICFKCLEEKSKLKSYHIYRDDYGSSFDNNHTHMNICSDCRPVDIDKWFDEEPERGDHFVNYKFESKIIKFAESFPLEGQELFWNRCAHTNYTMDSQDWIDDKLGILPDEVYEEEYGMYSPRQIKSYKVRFPTCEHPVNAAFNDTSKGCYCPFGASGNYNQEADINVSTECYGCSKYKLRETPIKEMDYDTYKKYELYIKGKEYNDMFE